MSRNQKYHVKLTIEDRTVVEDSLFEQQIPETIRKRCCVLLMADEVFGKPPIQSEIASRCSVSDATVCSVVKDYATKGISYCLRRRTHNNPPNPPIITGEREARIIALACGEAPDGRSRWTVRLLAEKIVELGIMEKVSYETVRATLKKQNLSLT